MLALYRLSVGFADSVLLRVEMTLIRAPTVRIEVLNGKLLKQQLELFESMVLVRSEYLSGAMIDGVPQPSLLFFRCHKAPPKRPFLHLQPNTPRLW